MPGGEEPLQMIVEPDPDLAMCEAVRVSPLPVLLIRLRDACIV